MGKRRDPHLPKQPPELPVSSIERSERVRRLVGEGSRLLAARRPGEAVVKLQEAWRLDPDNVPAAINLGAAYILQGKHRLAVPVMEAASVLESDNAMVWSNLAAAYLGALPLADTQHQQKAIEAYEKALTLDPRAPHVDYNLGLIYLERNEPLRAALHFASALDTDPNDQDARHWLNKIQQTLQTDHASGEG
jgi:tetratricopeptide (TPR) repeat protein